MNGEGTAKITRKGVSEKVDSLVFAVELAFCDDAGWLAPDVWSTMIRVKLPPGTLPGIMVRQNAPFERIWVSPYA